MRPGRPGALEHHALEIVLDQLAYARAAVDMWDDLQEKVRRRERHLSRSRRIGCIQLAKTECPRLGKQRADCRLLSLQASRIETLGFSLRVAPRAAPALRPPPLRDDPSGLNLWPTRNRYLDLLLLMEFNETTRTSTAIFGGSQPLRQSTE